ncbi:glycosyltransferase [Planctomycetota bacterium]
MSATRKRPFVSVIIPVYNDENRIGLAIEALLKQTYPKDRFEIIVVDNGSTDDTKKVADNCRVRLLEETETQSSYASRNKGMAEARGSIYAFTDADCIPEPGWIEGGVWALLDNQAELAAGRVRFPLTPRSSAAEYYDALCNIRIKDNVETRGVAFTANLFVCKEVVDSIGPFPQRIRSGGDVFFTSRATTAGHKIVYAGQAIVEHPARDLRGLLLKSLRIGKGKLSILNKARQDNTMNPGIKPGRFLTDLNPFILRQRLIEDEFLVGTGKYLGIVAVAYLVLFTMLIGAFMELFHRGRYSDQ